MEIDFKLLYALQDKILDIVSSSDLKIYLSGGTALHRFHYKNLRYSEDLDFFNIDNTKSLDNFGDILKSHNISFKMESNESNFKRFVIDRILKIDIINDEVPHFGGFIKKNGLYIDNINNILSNKLSAVVSRSEARDIYDIYTILKYHQINKDNIIKSVKEKTADSIDSIIIMLQTFPLDDKYLSDIYFCNDKLKMEFKNEYSTTIDSFTKHIKDIDISNPNQHSKQQTKSINQKA